MRHLWCAAALALAACDGDGGGGDTQTGADASTSVDGAAATPDALAPDMAVEDPCGETAEGLIGCANLTAFAADLEMVAKPRPPGSDHWQTVQDRCAEVFEAAGFEVERHAYGTGTNVVGTLRGVTRPDEQVLVSAHYDHIEGCFGADDNASGTAAVLEAARTLGRLRYERTVVVACWDEEERGLIGSRAYALRAAHNNADIRANFVAEMLGTNDDRPGSQLLPGGIEFIYPDQYAVMEANAFRGDFVAVITDDGQPEAMADLERHAAAVELPLIVLPLQAAFRVDPSFGDFRRSDHAPFWEVDLPGAMLTDTANFRNPQYHCSRGQDDIATLDVEFAFRAAQAMLAAAASQAVVTRGEPAPAGDPLEDPPVVPTACDLLAQDCAGGDRCSMVFGDGGGIQCIAPADAPVGLGDECTRPTDVAGVDTCAAGLFCTFWGLPRADPPVRVCRAYCRAHTDCADDEACARLDRATRSGLCLKRCDIAAGTGCPDDTQCVAWASVEWSRAIPACTWVGDVPDGESCAMESCMAGHACIVPSGTQGARCARLCTVGDDCGEGRTCYADVRPGLPEGFGHCLESVPE